MQHRLSARILAGLLFFAIPQIFTSLLAFIVPFLAPVWAALGFTIGALGLAYDVLDWPLARRGMDARERLVWMWVHRGLTSGLGLAIWVMFWIPGLSIVLLPAAVVGAVRLVNEVEGSSPPSTT